MKIDAFINQIKLGDCLVELKKIPSESVDMVFADPPFNLKKKYNHYRDKKEVEEYLDWCYQWLDEMVRVVKPSGSLFVHNIPRWLTYFSAHLNDKLYFRHWIAWEAAGAPLGKTLLPNHYGILFYVKSITDFKFYDIRTPHKVCRICGSFLKDYGGKKALMHPFGTLLSDVWTDIHRYRHKSRRDEHPCQLPIPLLERLILMTTDVDDIVLDPFMGIGTTAIAAKRLGRKYVGIEIDPSYVAITQQKISETEETKINDVYVSLFLNQIRTIRDVDFSKLEHLEEQEIKSNKSLFCRSKEHLLMVANQETLGF